MKHIIDDIWPTLSDLAADLGKPYPTVAAWKRRGSIPARYDLQLVQAARKRGHTLTFEGLAIARSASREAEKDRGAA
jgi:hypothetical protein